MLIQINIWLDVIFSIVMIVAIAFVTFHWGCQLVNGRAHKKYSMGKWPDHSNPPATPKWLHATHAVCIILLAFTGMMIRFYPYNREFMRYLHWVAMVIVTVNLIWRVWYAFFSERRDYKEFAFTKMDFITALQVLGYYVFIFDSKPHLDKYNVAQKFTYNLFFVMMIAQVFTGFALVFQFSIPIINLTPRELLIGWWLAPLVGSIDMAGWYMRTVHYVINWLFIMLTAIHIYMAFTEDFPGFLEFFGGARWMGMPKGLQDDWKRGNRHNFYDDLHGGDDHGHAEVEEIAPEQPVVIVDEVIEVVVVEDAE